MFKRFFDFILSLLGLILSSPLWVLIIACIFILPVRAEEISQGENGEMAESIAMASFFEDFKDRFDKAKDDLKNKLDEGVVELDKIKEDVFDFGKRFVINIVGSVTNHIVLQEEKILKNLHLTVQDKEDLVAQLSELKSFLEARKMDLQNAQEKGELVQLVKESYDFWKDKRLAIKKKQAEILVRELNSIIVKIEDISISLKEISKSYENIGIDMNEVNDLIEEYDQGVADVRRSSEGAIEKYSAVESITDIIKYLEAGKDLKDALIKARDTRVAAKKILEKIKSTDLTKADLLLIEGVFSAKGQGQVVISGQVTSLEIDVQSASVLINDRIGDLQTSFTSGDGSSFEASDLKVFSGNGAVSGSDLTVTVAGEIKDLKLDGDGTVYMNGQGKFWVDAAAQYNWLKQGITIKY